MKYLRPGLTWNKGTYLLRGALIALVLFVLWAGSTPAGALTHASGTNAIERVSVDSSGAGGNGFSFLASISSDGRYVAFESLATNLVAGDTNGTSDVFVHDRQTGATERVSLDSAGNEGNSVSFDPSISSDGRYVAFESPASNLVAGDTNGTFDVFVHDRQIGATERVSVDSVGNESNSSSENASISSDGRFVAFDSFASNLVVEENNGKSHVYVHDRLAGSTEKVSVDASGTQGNNHSFDPSISADGRYVAFESAASNLVEQDTNGANDVFVHDRDTDTNDRVSVDSSGSQADPFSHSPSISSDGRYVAFDSFASNLVPGDAGNNDIFVALSTLSPAATCNGVVATIVGTPGPDVLVGTSGVDAILGLDGDDVIRGKGGDDIICGGRGKDTLNGQNGKDRIYGGPGPDLLIGGRGNDRLFGGPGKDVLRGNGGADKLFGNGGPDRLFGGGGNDRCNGGLGNDIADGTCEVTIGVP